MKPKSLVAVLLLVGTQAIRIRSNDVFDDPDQVEDLGADWQEKQAQEFAAKIDTEGPKTQYAQDHTFEEKTNKIENHLLERIDMIDPSLSADLTREFMDVQKTQNAIKRLEARVEAESHGFDQIEEYNSDKMMLENMKRQLHEDAQQTIDSDAEIKEAVEKSHSNLMKNAIQQALEKQVSNLASDATETVSVQDLQNNPEIKVVVQQSNPVS